MTKNILVIGGTGFIGDYLIHNLSLLTSRTTVLYRETEPTQKLKNITYKKLDASKETEKFRKILQNVTHLVILSRPDEKIIKNITTSNSKIEKIIFASTILIYPDSRKPQDESSKLIAANPYEQGKIDEEKILIEFSKNSAIKICIARFTNIFGDVKNRGLVHFVLDALINNKTFKLNNDGKQIRDFLFVEDAAKYLELLILDHQKNSVEIFNICSGTGHSAKQLISEVEKITGKKLDVVKGEVTPEKLCVIGNNSKIIKTTGYKPAFSFEEGLNKAISNYQN